MILVDGFRRDSQGLFVVVNAADVDDYGFDLRSWLGADALTSSTWLAPAGIQVSQTAEFDGVTSALIGPAQQPGEYVIEHRVTAGGRVKTLSFRVIAE